MENTSTIPTKAMKQVKMPKSIDESQMTEEELCNDLLEALDQIERGEVYTVEEVEAELNRLYGVTFD